MNLPRSFATSVARLTMFLLFASLTGFSPAKANYVYDVSYAFSGNTVTGDIVLNCNSCSLTGSDVISYSLTATGTFPLTESGGSGNFLIVGTDLSGFSHQHHIHAHNISILHFQWKHW